MGIDDAIQWSNGRTYFFVDGDYYRFNDNEFKIDDGGLSPYPRSNSEWWYGCSSGASLNQDGEGEDTELVIHESNEHNDEISIVGSGSAAVSAAALSVLSSCLMVFSVMLL